jgi:6-phosphogluconate dehydrogenase
VNLGMVGLGRMGGNMAERLRRAGHDVVGYDRDPNVSQAATLIELVEALGDGRRAVWVMVPAGRPTDAVIDELAALLGDGDVVVDGGNAWYRDSMRRGAALEAREIGFVDAGVSGGVWGLTEGYCLMVGGSEPNVRLLQPVFDALAPPDGGFAHVGPVGAGHFAKMVHNGIEYGLMQAYAEGYELLAAADIDLDAHAAVRAWRHGSVVRSWLLDLLVRALDDDPDLTTVRGWAEDSGEGRWTVQEAVRLAVPAPAISASLYARFASRQEESPAMKVIAALRREFGGHAVKDAE